MMPCLGLHCKHCHYYQSHITIFPITKRVTNKVYNSRDIYKRINNGIIKSCSTIVALFTVGVGELYTDTVDKSSFS